MSSSDNQHIGVKGTIISVGCLRIREAIFKSAVAKTILNTGRAVYPRNEYAIIREHGTVIAGGFMYDIVAIGDATMDVFMQIDDASVACDIDKQNCKLQLNYADKIAAKTADFIIGGNAANIAVGARRLGLSSAFLSTIGDDDTGRRIQQVFRTEGVSPEYLTVDPNALSNYSVVINFQGERTILVHHEPRQYVWNIYQPPQWVYLTSMGEGFEPIYDKVIQLVRENTTCLAFNPGTHQLNKGLDFLKPYLGASKITFLNREETANLLGLPQNSPMPDLLKGLKNTGSEIVVITDGANGSYSFDGSTMLELGLYEGPVVERTGCGDAYATTFTVAIIEGKSINEAMQWGNANSTSVLAQIGPEAGLLNQDGVMQMIAKNPTVIPRSLN